MSYGRNPHYIWSDGDELFFEPNIRVPEHLINAFLYKILLKTFREDLKERLKLGKQQWMFQYKYNHEKKVFDVVPQDQEYIDWMEENEDEFLKDLLK